MVVYALQEPYDFLVLDPIVHFGSIPATAQDAFVLHHIKLLTGDGLFAAQGRYNIADAHLCCLQQLDNLQPDRMGHCLQNLSYMFCYLLIHFEISQKICFILLYSNNSIYHSGCSQKNEKFFRQEVG